MFYNLIEAVVKGIFTYYKLIFLFILILILSPINLVEGNK